MKRRKRVLIIHTGGTLGMLPRGQGFTRDLPHLVPELGVLADVQVESPFLIDSSSTTPEHWQSLARLVAGQMPDFDGFVITHGTDTMAYTASSLSFMLRNLRKPVVLTGAQRPLMEVRNDARSNLLDAVEVATRRVPEVVICFGGLVLRGNRARKRSLHDLRAFESPNHPGLGEVGVTLRLHRERFLAPRGRFSLHSRLDRRVVHVRLSPGFGSALLGLDVPEVKGVVLEAFGAGNLPLGKDSPVSTLMEMRKRGIPVVLVSGSEHGGVDLSLYEGGRAARRAGAISGGDMTGEAAVVKLMLALGQEEGLDRIRSFMETPLAGEREAGVRRAPR